MLENPSISETGKKTFLYLKAKIQEKMISIQLQKEEKTWFNKNINRVFTNEK